MNGVWVRSQNKTQMKLVTELFVRKDQKTIYGYNSDDGIELGTYATEARALEVMGLIQKHIEEMRKEHLMSHIGDKGTYDVIAWGESVFQMPES